MPKQNRVRVSYRFKPETITRLKQGRLISKETYTKIIETAVEQYTNKLIRRFRNGL